MPDQLKAMISSTARDLPEHRKQVVEACLRQGLFPLRMEDLPASSEESATASLKMVEEADVYIGVFANRYGYIPKTNNPDQISVTEMEYNRAVQRQIPRLVFVMDKSHPITFDDVDFDNAAKLKAFKDRVQTENICRFFKSPDDLKAEAINSLSQLRQPNLTQFHYVSKIPLPPESFIVHPYTLLQTPSLIGRQRELKLLTDWITGKELEFDCRNASADSVRIMSVVAIGGMGKSALTWKWFNDIAPQEMNNLAGRLWWSFYESDATFENFVIRALAYVSARRIQEIAKIAPPEREKQLLAALDQQRFLLVLDGLERILIAYARMDAARLEDNEVGKERNVRKTADPRAGGFLRKLAHVKQSRVLISSRLNPAELETAGGDPTPGSFAIEIEGLTDEDAVELWRAFGVSGSRDGVLPVFNTFAKHPLLIQALAGEVKRYRKAPGDFEAWRKTNHNFDPSKFSKTKEAMAHVLEFALRGLEDNGEKALQTIAAFRMPTNYDTLTAILVGDDKVFNSEVNLDAVLNELEDRGLMGWDKRANRYDLHPIVRAVVWSVMGDKARGKVYADLHAHFERLPWRSFSEIKSLEELVPTIELYNTLIGLGRYDEAYEFFKSRLFIPLLVSLSEVRHCSEILEMLFVTGTEGLPSLSGQNRRLAIIIKALTYHFSGNPRQATNLIHSSSELLTNRCSMISAIFKWDAFPSTGDLRETETSARKGIVAWFPTEKGCACDVISCWEVLGLTLAARGRVPLAYEALAVAHRRSQQQQPYHHMHSQSARFVYESQLALWLGNFSSAYDLARAAWREAESASEQNEFHPHKREFICASRVAGAAALCLGDFALAEEYLQKALTQARVINFVGDELPVLVALAELRRRQKDFSVARELLDDVWEAAERGPYPLFHADACNVLAQVEHDMGNPGAAIEAAMKAYRLAWCDGPPFAYHWGLEQAKKHLEILGAHEPKMPPFDESQFEPMPKVEIDPDEAFHFERIM